jgi:hypothetical protein
MSSYLQDPISGKAFEQLTGWLARDAQDKDIQYWVVGDGFFAPYLLTEGGILDWRPVFTQEPMSQYEEMGLFIAPLLTDPIKVRSAIALMKKFDGSPMFSFIATRRSEEQLKSFLTWLCDAHTDDGLSVYLRIGDTRCLPSIYDSLLPEQRHVLACMVNRWTWFERDGSIKNRLESELNKITDKAAETMQKRLTVTEQQYVKLVEAGETDLIHSTIMAIDSSIYPEKALKHKIFSLIEKLIGNGKKQGVTQLNEMKDYVLEQLIVMYETKKIK